VHADVRSGVFSAIPGVPACRVLIRYSAVLYITMLSGGISSSRFP
jgi:hypothetical protein